MRALAPSTLFLVRGAEAESSTKLADLVRRLPCLALDIGGPPSAAAAALARLLGGAGP
jgi:hypothetical protein